MKNKIGFIGGGQMGEALIRGIINKNIFDKSDIIVCEPMNDRCDYLEKTYNINTVSDDNAIWSECNIVILAVKPQIMSQVLGIAKDKVSDNHLIISIAAGLPISFYEQQLQRDTCKIIRVMPNTPALVLECAAGISGNKNVTKEEMFIAENIFNNIGKAIIIDETYLDAVTGLSGSGPAYVFTFIESLIDAGVKQGLTRDVAETLAMQTVLGSVKLMAESNKHPAELRAMVTSPGGTTIAGLHVMEKSGFRGIIMDTIEAAVERSKELGN